MDNQGTSSYESGRVDAPFAAGDRVIADRLNSGIRTFDNVAPGTRVGEDVMPVRNRVQWGPILAGLLTTVASMIVLTVLGLALGAAAFEPRDPGEEMGMAVAIWGAASAIVSFFLGGLVAAKSAAVAGPGTGLLNGLMDGFAAIAMILLLTGVGLGNLFGWVGGNLDDIATAVLGTTGVEQVTEQAQAQETDLRATFDEVRDGAWGTFAGLVLALGAATLGGWVGHNRRRDLIEGTR